MHLVKYQNVNPLFKTIRGIPPLIDLFSGSPVILFFTVLTSTDVKENFVETLRFCFVLITLG